MQDFIDEEFSYELLARMESGDKIAEEALEWIAKYNNEFYKGFLKKNDSKAIHKTPEHYKEATDAHNARRRDIISVAKSGKFGSPDTTLVSFEKSLIDYYGLKDQNINAFEDVFISLLFSQPDN